MFRRSRFSIRPNVVTTGRAAATPQEAPSTNQEASETPKDASEGGAPTDVTDPKSAVTPSEKPTASGDGNEQNAEGASSSAAVQRRKRFSVKPKVAPGRPSIAARTPKSPIKAVSEAPVDVPDSDFDKTAKSDQTATAAAPPGLQSPKRRRPSGESKQPKQPASSDSPQPSSAPVAEEPAEPTDPPTDSGKQLESSQIKEVPPKPPDKIHPSIPDKEAVEISEKAKTLVSTKTGLSLSPSALSLSRLLNDPSDLQRLAKAQKLRELLRQERHKEKKLKKSKMRIKEYTLDPAKMTMRDLIRYLPESNPMSSSLEETEENETIVPPSPAREESPERARGPEVVPTAATPRPGEEEEAEAEAEAEVEASEEDEDALMVPQVKVAEDGTLIIDEESLTVEVQRAKGPNPAQERDPIFERGSTTTYSSFRKGTYSKPWSSEETDMFFLAVSMVGTDFSMICQLFPHRARSEIKNKFKKEERENSWRIDKAFRERRKLDIEYFSKLLEKVLEVQQNKKKLKSLAVKNSPKKRSRKRKSKTKNEEDEDEEEEEEDEEDQLPDLEDEEEGEKENEDLCNEGAAAASKMKRRRKRKTKQAAMDDEPKEKKKKRSEKGNKQGEASVPEDTEAALPDDNTSSDVSKKTENANASKDGAIKPAKLSRGRAPKPLLPLGKKWSKKLPAASMKDKEADEGDETASEQVANEQVNEESSTSKQVDERKSADRDVSSEEEDAAVQPPRPTRYGRVPKPTNPLIYPAKEDPKTSASDATPASPQSSNASAAKPKPKSAAKRGRSSKQQPAQESKKPKLVTLRASQSEFSDEDDEKQTDREEVEEEEQTACSSSRDTVAPAFVPASLRSPHPVIPEVEETMEELDILANMPDVLGISQDALCPDASYDGAHNETAEPCEHQLDLLVDVIDFLSSEHTEVSEDESYNEAAQTLLTIGNLTHLSQSTIQDHLTDPTSVVVEEIRPNQEEEAASDAALLTSGHEITSREIVFSDPLRSSSPQPKKGRSTKVKPKPNLGRASRTARPESQQTDEDVNTEAANLQVTDSLSAPEPAQTPKIPEHSPPSSTDHFSLSEELPLSQETTASQTPERTGVQIESSRDATSESSNEKPTSPVAESLKSDASGLETQVERGSNADPAPLQEPVDPKAESDVASACQSRRSRLQKIKPKPNLAQTSRTARSKPQTKQDTSEKDVEPEPEAACPTSSLIPLFDSGSTLSVTEETITDVGPGGQERFGASTLDQTSSENFNLSADLFEPSSRETPSTSGDLATPETTDRPATRDSSVPKEDSEAASTSGTKRGRLQKIKPKPNLAQASRAARSKPQTKQDSSEKDADPTATSKINEKAKVEAACPASTLIPSLDSGSTFSVTEETVGPGGQECFGASALDRATLENLDLAADLFETPSTFESTVTSESSGNSVTPEKEESEAASTSAAKRARLPKVKPKPNLTQAPRPARSKPQTTNDSKPEPGSTDSPVAEAAEVETPTCSVTLPLKPTQSAGAASVSAPPLEISAARKPTESTSTVEQKTDVGMNSSSDGSEPNAPQRRRRFSRVKPNLGSSTRTTHTKPQPENAGRPSEPSSNVTSQQHVDNSQPAGDVSPSRSTRSPLNTELGSTKSAAAESEKTLGGRSDAVAASGPVTSASLAADNQPASTDSVPENNSREKSTGESEARGGKVSDNDEEEEEEEAGASSPGGRQPDPAAESSEDGSAESKVNPTSAADAGSLLHPKESSPQPFSQSLSLGKEEDEEEEGLETSETNRTSNKKSQSAQSTDDAPSELSDSSKSSNKAPQTRRGRLIKPKPNLGRSGRPSQAPQVQNAAQAEAALKETVEASVSLEPSTSSVSAQQPAGGAVEARGDQESTPNDPGSLLGRLTQMIEQMSQDAGSSLGCLTQASDGFNQTTSTPSGEGTQNHPSLTMFPDMLPEQVPSDPDEPFFILSLTEIPVCPSGEVADAAAEPLPYLPAPDASIRDQSVPGESLAAAGDGAVSDAPAESGETGLIGGPDPAPAPDTESLTENPVHPHEATAAQPPEPPQTEENNVETEVPRTRRGRRGAKAPAEPDAAGRKRAGEAAADEAVAKPRDGSGVRLSADKETPAPEGDVSAAQTNARKTKGGNAGRRKPKDLPPPSCRDASGVAASSDPPPRPRPPGRSAAGGSKVKTPAASTQSPRSPAQNRRTAADVELDAERGPDPRPAEASPQMDCVDEEPTNVSQYFLSDIFTEVEEVE